MRNKDISELDRIGGSNGKLQPINFEDMSKSKEELQENPIQMKRLKFTLENYDHENGMREQDLQAIDINRTRNYKESEAILWHLRLNHLSKMYLQLAAKILPELSGIKFTEEIENCEDCKLGKLKRKPFKEMRLRATKILESIHSDMMGEISPPGAHTGAKYIVTFTDDYSRYSLVYVMSAKTEVHIALKSFLETIRNLSGGNQVSRTTAIHNCKEGLSYKCKGGKLHMDNGMEFNFGN